MYVRLCARLKSTASHNLTAGLQGKLTWPNGQKHLTENLGEFYSNIESELEIKRFAYFAL